MLSEEANRKFCRCIEEMRRGKVPSRDMAADLLGRLAAAGFRVEESEPNLGAMADTLTAAGYKVEPPAEKS